MQQGRRDYQRHHPRRHEQPPRLVALKEIITWPQYCKIKLYGQQPVQASFDRQSDFNNKVSLWFGNITQLAIDAIVNAANCSLMGGGGVDGCIHRAAGQSLKRECAGLNGCETGDAKITSGHKLPSKYVIHTVGPVGEQQDKLESCYKRCLQIVEERQIKAVAFCCVSTGVYGYPQESAAKTALTTVRNWFETSNYSQNIDRIIFCVFTEADKTIYEQWLQVYFPIDSVSSTQSPPRGEHELTSSARNPEQGVSQSRSPTQARNNPDSAQ